MHAYDNDVLISIGIYAILSHAHSYVFQRYLHAHKNIFIIYTYMISDAGDKLH